MKVISIYLWLERSISWQKQHPRKACTTGDYKLWVKFVKNNRFLPSSADRNFLEQLRENRWNQWVIRQNRQQQAAAQVMSAAATWDHRGHCQAEHRRQWLLQSVHRPTVTHHCSKELAITRTTTHNSITSQDCNSNSTTFPTEANSSKIQNHFVSQNQYS